MRIPHLVTRAVIAMAGIVALLAAHPARADGVPSLNDGAGFFSAAAIQQADNVIHQIKQAHGYDLQIETFASIPPDVAATRGNLSDADFYGQWLRNNAQREGINGIYVLVVRDPRYLKVGIGRETAQRAFTQADKDHLFAILQAAFHQNQFDAGLLDGVQFVQQQIDNNLSSQSAAQPAPAPYVPNGSYSAPQSGYNNPQNAQPKQPVLFSGFGWIVAIVIALIVFNVIRGAINRHRYIGSNYGPGGPGFDPSIGNTFQNYGPQNYGPGFGNYGGGGFGGGGFGRGFFGGLLGGAAGSWLYDRFNNTSQYQQPQNFQPPQNFTPPPPSSGGGDFMDSGGGGGGGDFTSGGDGGEAGGSF